MNNKKFFEKSEANELFKRNQKNFKTTVFYYLKKTIFL